MKSTDLRTSVPKTGAEDYLIYNPFYDGVRVYVTLPGGKREGFTFRPQPAPGLKGGFLGIWEPRFVPDAGVTSTLAVPRADLRPTLEGDFTGYADGFAYNPLSPLFGDGRFTLTTADGMQYAIDGNTGDLRSVTDLNGNSLRFSNTGIVSSSGDSIAFERDSQNRITAVVDPLGQRVRYQYDASGDLVSVTDREGNRTEFRYADPTRVHFLTEIVDPLGRTGLQANVGCQVGIQGRH